MSSARFVALTLLGAALAAPGCGGESKTSTKPAGTDAAKGGSQAAAPAPAPAPAPKPPAEGGDSPEDVFAKAQAAAERKDPAAFLRLVAPDARKGLCAMFALMPEMLEAMRPMFAAMAGRGQPEGGEAKQGGSDLKKFDAAISEMKGIVAKHKLEMPSAESLGVNMMAGEPDPMDLGKKIGNRMDKVDTVALLCDLVKGMQKLGEAMPGGESKDLMAEMTKTFVGGAKLTDLKIEGDTATGKAGDEPGKFVRVGGRWFLSLEDKKKGGDGEGGGG
ncbi:MAG: hypothetical protein L0216_05570 [Planctomycetales bacterium]|nr:hypothetical protein [Planctomycetales bacterium]